MVNVTSVNKARIAFLVIHTLIEQFWTVVLCNAYQMAGQDK